MEKVTFTHPNAYHIYTDGSFRPPDNAACSYLIFSEKKKHYVRGATWVFRGATINQMELMAINKALDFPGLTHVYIYSDSQYTISALSIWRKGWEKRGWINPHGEPIKNKELIQEIGKKLDALKFVRFIKVKAHTGDRLNSMVDFMATQMTDRMRDNPSLKDGEYSL